MRNITKTIEGNVDETINEIDSRVDVAYVKNVCHSQCEYVKPINKNVNKFPRTSEALSTNSCLAGEAEKQKRKLCIYECVISRNNIILFEFNAFISNGFFYEQ